ncbi:potassium channel family protein [Candidatus Latescibacterota bacterium]
MKLHKTEEVRIILKSAIVIFAIFAYGVFGYMIIEGWSFLDSIYMVVITISTVGFSETNALSTQGRIHTVFLILFALSLLAYFFSRFVTIMVEGQINTLLRGRKMEKKISKLKDHYIICGYGKMGSQVSYEFKQSDVPFVVMDNNPEIFQVSDTTDLLYLVGDASREEDLERCGIRYAKGLISVLTEDQDNVYTILTALGIKSDIRIITRATDIQSEKKLKRAGATHVVSPFKIGGSRIASIMLRPSITHFLDGLAKAEEIRLTLVEVEVMENSRLAGRTIRDTGITDISESIIVGLRRPGDPIRIRPSISTELKVGDQLVLMGRLDAIQSVDDIVRPTGW